MLRNEGSDTASSAQGSLDGAEVPA
jgi:hypothetical protein